jgi:hypothetical protein
MAYQQIPKTKKHKRKVTLLNNSPEFIKFRSKNDIKKKERMIRTILFSFLDTLSADKDREHWAPSLTAETPYLKFWNNWIHTIFYIEELVLSFSATYQALTDKTVTPNRKASTKFTSEFTESLFESEYDISFYTDVHKSLFYSSKNKWQDARLLDTIFEIIEPIWYIKAQRRSSKVRKSMTAGYGK